MTLKKVTFFDPVFSKIDLEILTKHGYEVISTQATSRNIDDLLKKWNVDGKGGNAGTQQVVLFYMPHCEKHLYQQVLQTLSTLSSFTSSSRRAPACCIFGNSFDDNESNITNLGDNKRVEHKIVIPNEDKKKVSAIYRAFNNSAIIYNLSHVTSFRCCNIW